MSGFAPRLVGISIHRHFPQRLKPHQSNVHSGTAEAVPFPKSTFSRGGLKASFFPGRLRVAGLERLANSAISAIYLTYPPFLAITYKSNRAKFGGVSFCQKLDCKREIGRAHVSTPV